jgi:hypothetical protein
MASTRTTFALDVNISAAARDGVAAAVRGAYQRHTERADEF